MSVPSRKEIEVEKKEIDNKFAAPTVETDNNPERVCER